MITRRHDVPMSCKTLDSSAYTDADVASDCNFRRKRVNSEFILYEILFRTDELNAIVKSQ